MDFCSILNYQGSKRNLLDFIHSNVNNLISPESTVLDIFAGTCSVGYVSKEITLYMQTIANCILISFLRLY